jgi:hypothetical protein
MMKSAEIGDPISVALKSVDQHNRVTCSTAGLRNDKSEHILNENVLCHNVLILMHIC